MIDRVIVGTEGSEVAENAVSTALRIARAADAEIRGVHAVEHPSTYAAAPGFHQQVVDQRRAAGEQVLEDVRDKASKVDVPASLVVREADPDELLLDQAAEWDADLISIGAQGDSGLSRAIRGSVADQLIRSSPIPVLTVHQPPPADPLDPIERILLPSDGSDDALDAVPFALELAEATGARLDLLYAVPPEMEGGRYLDRPATEVGEVHERLAAQALEPIEHRCEEAGIPYSRFVDHEVPHRAIVGRADEGEADLIVMATGGRGGLERFLLGGVTDKVLRTSNVPVITVASGIEADETEPRRGRARSGQSTR